MPRAAIAKRVEPREPRTRLDVDERRQQLITLGLEHFGSRAYDDVSIDALAAGAGISKGLLYHYFPTKRAYYAAVIREAAAQLVQCSETPDDMPPVARLQTALAGYLGYVREHAKAYATLLRSGVGVDPEIARIVDATRATFLDRLTSGLAPGAVAAGSLDSPRMQLALRGWVGFAEAVSLGWSEALATGGVAPSQAEVETLIGNALLDILKSANVPKS